LLLTELARSAILETTAYSQSYYLGPPTPIHVALHIAIIIFSTSILGISIVAWIRNRTYRYLYIMIAFLFFLVREILTFYDIYHGGEYFIVLFGTDIPITHSLALVILVFFALGIFKK
jgi:hypothetical protein